MRQSSSFNSDSDSDADADTNSNNGDNVFIEPKVSFENEQQDVIILREIAKFLTEPNSSLWSFTYCTISSIIVLTHILVVCMESTDGPNQYTNRQNNAAYDFMMNEEQYWTFEQVLLYPIVADSIVRTMLLCIFAWKKYRHVGFSEVFHSLFKASLFVCDIVGICPFLLKAAYLQPQRVYMPQFARLSYRMFDLFQIGKVLRSIKDVPSIWAIRLTLYRALPKLVLPIFFFVVCNVTTAVIFYFMEPCYDTGTCAWDSLFSSAFFSVVTMSTVGYGNQIPYYESTRLVACFVMIFGALFMSMPLAIIGNEYEDAWKYVAIKVDEFDEARRLVHAQQEWESYKRKMPLTAAQMDERSLDGSDSDNDNEKQEGVRPSSPIDPEKENKNEDGGHRDSAHRRALVPTAVGGDRKHTSRGRIRGDSLVDENEANEGSGVGLDGTQEFQEEEESNDGDELDDDFMNTESVGHGKVVPMYAQDAPLVQGVIDPFNKIKALIRKVDQCLVQTHAMTPTVLLTACQLVGWFTPLLYAINGVSMDVHNRGKLLQEECEDEKVTLSDAYAVYENTGKVEQTPKKQRRRLSILGGNLAEFILEREQDAQSSDQKLEEERIKYMETNGVQVVPSLNSNSRRPKLSRSGRSAMVSLKEPSVFDPMKAEEMVNSIKTFALKHKSVVIYGKQMRWAQAHPNSFRARIWMALEQPHGSNEGRIMQLVLLTLICLSILLLFTETLASWTDYGEQTKICEKVLRFYCAGKHDNTKDPGCFVQAFDATGVSYTTNDKLQFGVLSECTGADCFGVAPNYGSVFNEGSLATNMSCIYADSDDPLRVSPFQSSEQLIKHFGSSNMFSTRELMHRQSNVCKRLECDPLHEQLFDGNRVWILYESIINGVFLLELGVRVSVSFSVSDFLFDRMNILDILCVVPFVIDLLVTTFSKGGIASMNLAFTVSTPDPLILVLLRSFKIFFLFKIFRHFKESKVLVETFNRAWKQLLAILSLMVFMVTLFGIIMYELERGDACYVGDANCVVPDSIADSVNIGDAILLNKYGEVTTVPNVFYGIWFSIVTIMTVGYGEIVPVTNGGMFMSVWLMLFGGLYMAMPLTVAATTYYMVHDLYHEKKELQKEVEKQKRDAAEARHANATGNNDEEDQDNRDVIGSIMAEKMSLDLSEASNHRNGKEVGLSFAKGHTDNTSDMLKRQQQEEVVRLEKMKKDALAVLNDVKISAHKSILKKLANMQFALEEIMEIIADEGAKQRKVGNSAISSPLAKAKNSAYKGLYTDMQKTVKLLAFFTASKDTPLAIATIQEYTKEAMFGHINKLCKLHKRCVFNIHQYLSSIIRDMVIRQCDMKMRSVAEFLGELQKPSQSTTKDRREYVNDSEDDEKSVVDYDVDEDFDKDFEYDDFECAAPTIDRSTLPGQYQRIVNNTSGFVRDVEKDIICVCSISVALNVTKKDTSRIN